MVHRFRYLLPPVLVAILFLFGIPSTAKAQNEVFLPLLGSPAPDDWVMLYNHPFNEVPRYGDSLLPLGADGYLIAGHVASQPWLARVDALGNLMWEGTYGHDYLEGSFVDGTPVLGYKALTDYYAGDKYQSQLLSLDADGNLLFRRLFVFSQGASPGGVIALADGGTLVMLHHLGTPFGVVLIRLDAAGNELWHRFYPTPGWTIGGDIIPTSDGGFMMVASAEVFGATSAEAWVVKLYSTGFIQWQKAFGVSGADSYVPRDVLQTSDGGYLIAGETEYCSANCGHDGWVLRLDASGNNEWRRAIDTGGADDRFLTVGELPEGQIILAGSTRPAGSAHLDSWIVGLGQNGSLNWSNRGGGNGLDVFNAMAVAADGDIELTGYSGSWAHPSAWLANLPGNGSTPGCPFFSAISSNLLPVDFTIQNTGAGNQAISFTTSTSMIMPGDPDSSQQLLCPVSAANATCE